MKEVIDNFSGGAENYAMFRPQSPPEIFDFLYNHSPAFNVAWDCGTGNGQVAAHLADRFTQVYGTDISREQMDRAIIKPGITYMQQRAESTSLASASVDLVTVAQAIHWFDINAFFREVQRVCRPGALVAAWTYTTLKFNDPVDVVIDELYSDITLAYWNKERAYVDSNYSTIPFPLREIATPGFQIVKQMSLSGLLGYLRTWSGVQNYVRHKQQDPILLIANKLHRIWGSYDTKEVTWPVYMRAGYVD